MKRDWLVLLFLASCEVCFGLGNISDVSCSQRWPWSGEIDVHYTLKKNLASGERLAVFQIGLEVKSKDGKTVFDTSSLYGDGASGLVLGEGKKVLTWNSGIGNEKFTGDISVTVKAEDVTGLAEYLKLDCETGRMAYEGSLPSAFAAEDKTRYLWLARVRAGNFGMGSASDLTGRCAWEDNESLHDVALTEDFYIGIFELTQGQAAALGYVVNSGYCFAGDTLPVENVTYEEIRGTNYGKQWPGKTSRWVDKGTFFWTMREKTGQGLKFDLPTEAMWEFACNGSMGSGAWNDGRAYSGAYNYDNGLTNTGWYAINGKGKTHEVGLLKPSASGVVTYDMHGNVWEMCLDWYGKEMGTAAVSDPCGPNESAASYKKRVMRGGSWHCYSPWTCRSSFRLAIGAVNEGNFETGLRVALTR